VSSALLRLAPVRSSCQSRLGTAVVAISQPGTPHMKLADSGASRDQGSLKLAGLIAGGSYASEAGSDSTVGFFE
jgi:hypothetical protein